MQDFLVFFIYIYIYIYIYDLDTSKSDVFSEYQHNCECLLIWGIKTE